MKRDDAGWLDDAEAHLRVLREHLAAGVRDDQLVLDAAALRLSAVIDSVARVDDARRRAVIDDVSWRAIVGTRNRIAHGYGFIDPVVLRGVLETDLDELATYLAALRRRCDEARG